MTDEPRRGEEVEGPDRGHNPRRRAIYQNHKKPSALGKNFSFYLSRLVFWWFLSTSEIEVFSGFLVVFRNALLTAR